MDIGDLTSIQIYEDNVQGVKGETNLENMDDSYVRAGLWSNELSNNFLLTN